MFEHHMSRLKGVLSKKEYEKAGYQLTDLVIKAYQKRVLKSRIWLYVARIDFDKRVSTARIHLKTGFVTFGVDFFLNHIISIEDLLFLMLHERNHKILEYSIWRADLYYLRRSLPTPLFLLAEDAFVNATAFRTAPSSISDRFYSHNRLTVILTSNSKAVKKVFDDKVLGKIHTRMWNPNKDLPDFGEFSGAFVDWFMERKEQERNRNKGNDIRPRSEGQTDKSEAEKEIEAIVPIVEGYDDTPVVPDDPIQPNPMGCSESGNLLCGNKIEAVTPKSEIDKALNSLTQKERNQFKIRQSFDISPIDTFISDFQCLRAGHDGIQGYTNTVPHRISKRDLNSIQIGGMPVVWNTTYEGFKIQTKLYMDVSSSMDTYLGMIPYIFSRLMEHVDEIFEFSTEIVKVDPNDNYYYSTGGTNFNKVAKHILEKGFQSVIIISDGISSLSDDLTGKLKNQLEFCAYVKIGGISNQRVNTWENVADQIINISI